MQMTIKLKEKNAYESMQTNCVDPNLARQVL